MKILCCDWSIFTWLWRVTASSSFSERGGMSVSASLAASWFFSRYSIAAFRLNASIRAVLCRVRVLPTLLTYDTIINIIIIIFTFSYLNTLSLHTNTQLWMISDTSLNDVSNVFQSLGKVFQPEEESRSSKLSKKHKRKSKKIGTFENLQYLYDQYYQRNVKENGWKSVKI